VEVIQHVREKFSCRSCETIAQTPAPSHPIARGRAGPMLLAHILFCKYSLHLPLNRQSSDDRLQGCVRLLPSAGPNMLRDTFPALLDGRPAPVSPQIWESSRFALDAVPNSTKAAGGLTRATYELFAGMIEFGLSRRLTDIVTVTDVRMERILRRAGWPLARIGEPTTLDATLAVAGYLKVSADGLARVRSNGDLRRPVLWAPVARAAAA